MCLPLVRRRNRMELHADPGCDGAEGNCGPALSSVSAARADLIHCVSLLFFLVAIFGMFEVPYCLLSPHNGMSTVWPYVALLFVFVSVCLILLCFLLLLLLLLLLSVACN